MHEKNRKSSAADGETQKDSKPYMLACEETIRETSTDYAQANVAPADYKWFTRLVVPTAVIETLEEMDLAFPRINRETRKRLAAARAALNGHSRGNNGKGQEDDGK